MSKVGAAADHDEWCMIKHGKSTEDRFQKERAKYQRKCGKEKQRNTSPHNFSFAGTQM